MHTDIEQLQGTWNITSLEMDGRTIPGAALGGAKISIQGDHFISTGMGATYEGTIEVDPAATPKTFSLNFTTGPEKGNVNVGIYELGSGTWRICLATRGAIRPQEFAAPPGTGIVVEGLERVHLECPIGALRQVYRAHSAASQEPRRLPGAEPW